jgi:hypothetical protein
MQTIVQERWHPLVIMRFILQCNRPHKAMDGWPSGYGASFRISFRSLVFGRGFEPHSIQNLGASVLPVLAVFPFCLRCVLLIFIPQPALSSYTSPDRNRKVWDHAPLVDQRQAIFAVWSSRIFYRIPTFPTWFSSSLRFLIVLLCQLHI